MKIGLYATGAASASYHNLLDQVQYAEEAGFDSVWLRERHFHTDDQGRNFFASPFVAASYIAARTKRIRIGMGARILPLDHPIHIAEDAATVDVISNGRLDFGIARIGENQLYQSAFGIDVGLHGPTIRGPAAVSQSEKGVARSVADCAAAKCFARFGSFRNNIVSKSVPASWPLPAVANRSRYHRRL